MKRVLKVSVVFVLMIILFSSVFSVADEVYDKEKQVRWRVWNDVLWEYNYNKSIEDGLYNKYGCWHIEGNIISKKNSVCVVKGNTTTNRLMQEDNHGWIKNNEFAEISYSPTFAFSNNNTHYSCGGNYYLYSETRANGVYKIYTQKFPVDLENVINYTRKCWTILYDAEVNLYPQYKIYINTFEGKKEVTDRLAACNSYPLTLICEADSIGVNKGFKWYWWDDLAYNYTGNGWVLFSELQNPICNVRKDGWIQIKLVKNDDPTNYVMHCIGSQIIK